MMFINEIIKILKKKSTIIIFILAIFSLFACVGFVKLMDIGSNYISDGYMQYQIEEYNTKISEIKGSDEVSLNAKKQFQNIINLLKYADTNKIDLNNQSYYMSNSINNIINNIQTIVNLEDKEKIKETQDKINKYNEVVKEKSFEKYTLCLEEDIKLIEDEKNKKNQEYELQLIKKYEIGKTDLKEDAWKSTMLSQITSINESLASGIDYKTQKPFTLKQIEKYKDNLKIAEYKLENNIKED
ncbi:MAG: hypothetical protein RSA08_02300, partial [Clostridia bacterium]